MLTFVKNTRKPWFRANLCNRGECAGSLPAAQRHAAHLDSSSRVIGLIKSSSLPGPSDKCGVVGQTADGCAAHRESAHSDGARGSDSGIANTTTTTSTPNTAGTGLVSFTGAVWTLDKNHNLGQHVKIHRKMSIWSVLGKSLSPFKLQSELRIELVQ